MKRGEGFTLIELMVALAVVSVLGILSFRAIASATQMRDRLNEEQSRWREISRFVRRVEVDLPQMLARHGAPGGDARLTRAAGASGGIVEFSFLRGDGARNQTRRHGYRFEAGRVLLLRWPGSDAASLPRQDVVLTDVKGLRFRFHQADGRASDTWPPDAMSTGTPPVAIDMELELADAGTIHRLVALR
jgi:general secretion pathway protein J